MIKTSLSERDQNAILNLLKDTDPQSISPTARQPIHSVYGGAHLFRCDTAKKLGGIAQNLLKHYAPNFVSLAHCLKLPGHTHLADDIYTLEHIESSVQTSANSHSSSHSNVDLMATLYQRIQQKLMHEPIEDHRIDFEDGYGHREDHEEDSDAIQAAEQLALGYQQNSLAPFIGIRIKSLHPETRKRAIRTLDIFLSKLAEKNNSTLPTNFVVTLPKVTDPKQVEALARLLAILETKCDFTQQTINIDLMIETPLSLINKKGIIALQDLINAAQGRCQSVAFGTYDYTALCDIISSYQHHNHPSADFARHLLKVALAGTGVRLSDGTTTQLPVPLYPSTKHELNDYQVYINARTVHSAWLLHFNNILHSLKHGYYQGWDVHPAQLPIRYAAQYYFFLTGLNDAATRLKAFLEKAAKANRVGATFDDAATGQGLINFFLQGLTCGALNENDVQQSGLTPLELQTRSFIDIINHRNTLKI